MTGYRNDTLEGTVGAVPNGAAIGMTTLTGTPEYVAPGWDSYDSCVEYGVGDYATLTTSIASYFFDDGTFKFVGTPSADAMFWEIRNVSDAEVASMWVNDAGFLELHGTASSVDTSTMLVDTSDWFRMIIETNQEDGRAEMRVRVEDRLGTWLDTLHVPIGGQPIASLREGSITAATGMVVRRSFALTRTEPIYRSGGESICYTVYDDASANLMMHSPEAIYLGDNGVTFDHNYVSTPLCSPSRAGMYSGKFPQNNGVTGNAGMGEWLANPLNDQQSAFRLLSDLGYAICYVGKYLNGYAIADGVPPGIDWCIITDSGTGQFDYEALVSRDGVLTTLDTTGGAVGSALEGDYLNDVIADFTLEFQTHMAANRPGQKFFIFMAPYSPHAGLSADPDTGDPDMSAGAPPAPRDRPESATDPANWDPPEFPITGDLGPGGPQEVGGAPIPWPDYLWTDQATNWNTLPVPTPGWMAPIRSGAQLMNFNLKHENRIRAVQSVNDMHLAVRTAIEAEEADNTWYIFTSDNGYHLGEHGQPDGKGAIYDEDVRLPLIVMPPGGMAPTTVTSIVQNVDLLPTWLDIADHPEYAPADLDGKSWLGFVQGSAPSEWRQTAFVQYKGGDVTWEESLGTGEPPGWYMITTGDSRYATYDQDNPGTIPSVDMGEAYDLTLDPGMIVNIYAVLEPWRTWPAQALLQAYLSGSGESSWEAGLQSFSWSSSAQEGGEVYVFDGTDLTDEQRRWFTTIDTDPPGLPSKISDDITLLGSDGILVSDDPYDETVTIGAAYLSLTQRITDRDSLGRSGGPFMAAQNKTAQLMLFAPRGVRTLAIRAAEGMPIEWEARARVLGAITPRQYGPSDSAARVPFQLPDGSFRSRLTYTWALVPFQGSAGQNVHVSTLAGSQAPVRGAIIRVGGPCNGFDMTDDATGHMMQYLVAGPNVDLGEYLLVDTLLWRAVIVDNDTWDFDDASAVDVSAHLDSSRGAGDLFVMQPVPYLGDPFDRRVYVTATGGSRTADTTLQIRAYRTRYA